MTPSIAIGGPFLSRELCSQVVQEIERDGCWQWGEINHGGRSHVDLDFRRVQWCPVPQSCRTVISARLLAIARGLALHFGPVRQLRRAKPAPVPCGRFLPRTPGWRIRANGSTPEGSQSPPS